MDAGPRIDSYEWAGGREPMLRFGPEVGPSVVLALPLLEEANRTRAFGVAILRALAEQGVGGALPDLPGQGESMIATSDATIANLRAAFAAIPATAVAAIRSGALLLDERPAWLLSPQTGAQLLRELGRVKGEPLTGEHVEVAGNRLSRGFIDELAASPPDRKGPDRVVRLATDLQPADRRIDGPPLWRRAEPDNDHAFAQVLAADIAEWIATCGA